MGPDKTTPEARKAEFDAYYRGDLVTLRLLLGACLLLWGIGLVRALLN